MLKNCYVCKQDKELEHFAHANNSKGQDNRAAYCLVCSATLSEREKSAIVTKLWRIRNREQYVRTHENYSLSKSYVISIEKYEEMLREQNNVCAVCGLPPESVTTKTGEVRKLCVDHDHKTGAVRSLLCQNCNIVLGHIEANPERVHLLCEYLKRHRV